MGGFSAFWLLWLFRGFMWLLWLFISHPVHSQFVAFVAFAWPLDFAEFPLPGLMFTGKTWGELCTSRGSCLLGTDKIDPANAGRGRLHQRCGGHLPLWPAHGRPVGYSRERVEFFRGSGKRGKRGRRTRGFLFWSSGKIPKKQIFVCVGGKGNIWIPWCEGCLKGSQVNVRAKFCQRFGHGFLMYKQPKGLIPGVSRLQGCHVSSRKRVELLCGPPPVFQILQPHTPGH